VLRGCRWQFTLFLLAALSLAAGLVWRDFLRSDPEQGDSDPPPATTAAIATPDTGPVDAPVIGEMDGAVDIPAFREGLVGSLAHLNPLLAAPGSLEAQVGGLIYEGLTGLNSQGEPVPELAAGLSVTTSGLEYVVTLRDDVLWLPVSAIRQFSGRNFIVVQNEGLQRRVDVRLGLEGDGRVEILEGAEENQTVIGP